MGKSAWRGSELLPVRVKIVLAVFSVVTIVSELSLSLLPEDHFGLNSSLIFNVVGYSQGSIPPHPIAIFVNDTAPPPENSLADFSADPSSAPAPSAGSKDLDKNSSSDIVSVTEDSSLVPSPEPTPSPSPSPSPAAPEVSAEHERFLTPLLSSGVGAGNQLIEYISAAVIAKATNRTLCLPPFFSGPGKHRGLSVHSRGGLMLGERYNVSSFARFTRVASLEHCLQQCNYTLDSNVLLRPVFLEPIIRGWKNFQYRNESWNMEWNYVEWQSTGGINATLGDLSDRCVGLGGLFPGMRWIGAFLAVSGFIQPALLIFEAANALQTYGIGKDTPYLAVHWRFEESSCPKHQIGLCFSRCTDGSVFNSGLHPVAKEWLKLSENECRGNGHFRGVGLSKMDIIATIEERAAKHNLSTIYMATDGWIRGAEGLALVKEVVLLLRRRGLYVIGLWSISGLPNFSDGTYYDPYITMGRNHVINGQQIALVEQEICVRSAVFLGSGQSTWSLAVFRLRLAKRRSAEILAKVKNAGRMDLRARDDLISETLLKDDHAAGWSCHYSRFMNRATVNETVETYADEFPDGWLDLDACEGRIGRGGHCQVAKCF